MSLNSLNAAVANFGNVTKNLDWGVNGVLRDALGLAAEGKIRLVHSVNVSEDGRPCLINAVRQMLTTGNEEPAQLNSAVVCAFDRANCEYRAHLEHLATEPVSSNEVYPALAEMLLMSMGEAPARPELTPEDEQVAVDVVTPEISDELIYSELFGVN